jgi:hypothetical protein
VQLASRVYLSISGLTPLSEVVGRGRVPDHVVVTIAYAVPDERRREMIARFQQQPQGV